MEHSSNEVAVESTDALSFSDESDDVALVFVESSLDMDLVAVLFRVVLDFRLFSRAR